MTGAELVAEIADMLEEDHLLNVIWTEAGLFKYVTQNFPEIARDTGGSDYKDTLTDADLSTGVSDLITNGGFENGNATPDDWAAGQLADLDRHSADFHSGSYCLEINEDGANNPYAFQQGILLVNSTKYLLTFWAKAGTGTAGRYGTWDDSKGYHSNTTDFTATNTWVQHRAVFETPAGMGPFRRLVLYHYVSSGAGTSILYDDVSLKQLVFESYTLTNPETFVHLYEVHYQSLDASMNLILPTIDIQEADMLTGVTDPYTTGTPQAVSVETVHSTSAGVSTYQPGLRPFPFPTTGGTFTAFYKTAPTGTSVLTHTVQMREPFRLALKFKCLADALSEDTELRDPERAEVWSSLSQVLVQSLKSLYSGGQLI